MNAVFESRKLMLGCTLCLAGMIVVFAAALTLGTALKSQIMTQGTKGNMILVDAGADTPMFSSLPTEVYEFVRTVPGIAEKDGAPMVTQCLQIAGLVYGYFTNVRGVDAMYYHMYDQYRLVEGRLPAAKNEIMIGTLLPEKIKQELRINDTLSFEGDNWVITGIYEDPLTVMGSGIVARLGDLKQATHREHISFVSLRARDHNAMAEIAGYINKTFAALLMENPDIPGVMIESEEEYYHHEAEAINPLVLFFNLVGTLYLLVGAVIVYNLVDSMVAKKGANPPGASRTFPGSVFASSALIIIPTAVCAAVLAALSTMLIARISLNFMMMTLFLRISMEMILISTLVTALVGMAPALAVMRRVSTHSGHSLPMAG